MMYEPPHWTKPRLARIAKPKDGTPPPVTAKPDEPTIADLQKQLADMREGMRFMADQIAQLIEVAGRGMVTTERAAVIARQQYQYQAALDIVNGLPDPRTSPLGGCGTRPIPLVDGRALYVHNVHIAGRQDRN